MPFTGGALTFATLAQIAGIGLGVVGAVVSSRAAKASAEYDAQVSRNNAIIAEQNAEDARKRGKIEADEQRKRVNQTVGATRASLAANGLLIDDGTGTTSAGLLSDVRDAGELDILTIKHNSELEARRYELQANSARNTAGGLSLKAKSYNPFLDGVTAGVSGYANSRLI